MTLVVVNPTTVRSRQPPLYASFLFLAIYVGDLLPEQWFTNTSSWLANEKLMFVKTKLTNESFVHIEVMKVNCMRKLKK